MSLNRVHWEQKQNINSPNHGVLAWNPKQNCGDTPVEKFGHWFVHFYCVIIKLLPIVGALLSNATAIAQCKHAVHRIQKKNKPIEKKILWRRFAWHTNDAGYIAFQIDKRIQRIIMISRCFFNFLFVNRLNMRFSID